MVVLYRLPESSRRHCLIQAVRGRVTAEPRYSKGADAEERRKNGGSMAEESPAEIQESKSTHGAFGVNSCSAEW